MKITLAFELKKCTSEVPAPFSLISMARLSKQADTSVDYLGFIKNNVTVSFPCFSSGLVYLHKEGASDASARKKNLFEHNIQGFSNSLLLGSGVVSHS